MYRGNTGDLQKVEKNEPFCRSMPDSRSSSSSSSASPDPEPASVSLKESSDISAATPGCCGNRGWAYACVRACRAK